MHKLRATTFLRKASFESNNIVPFNRSLMTSKLENNALSKSLIKEPTFIAMTEVDEHPKTPVVVRELINKDKKQKKGVMRDIAILLLSMKTWLSWCYVAAPVCYYYYFSGGSTGVQFWSAFVAMIPMASLLGDLTEVLAAHTGDLIGGLVNATLGNAVEMIITVQCLRKGLLQIVTGQLIGSILSNLLLVLGCSFLCGGVVHYVQRFNADGARCSTSLLMVSCLAFMAPTLLAMDCPPEDVLISSRLVALVIGATYVLFLLFQLGTHLDLFRESEREGRKDDDGQSIEEEEPEVDLSLWFTMTMLILVTLLIAFTSSVLVGQIEEVSKQFGIPQNFIGVILLPVVGNAAEHATAVTVAIKNKPDLTMGVAVGSSTQIAMFMVPFAVIVGWCMGVPMTLAISPISCVLLFIAVAIVVGVVQDGESNWLEGVMLIVAYIIVAIVYWYDIPVIRSGVKTLAGH